MVLGPLKNPPSQNNLKRSEPPSHQPKHSRTLSRGRRQVVPAAPPQSKKKASPKKKAAAKKAKAEVKAEEKAAAKLAKQAKSEERTDIIRTICENLKNTSEVSVEVTA